MFFLDQICESICSCFSETKERPQALVYIPSQDITMEDDYVAWVARKYDYLYEDPEMEIWFRRECRDW